MEKIRPAVSTSAPSSRLASGIARRFAPVATAIKTDGRKMGRIKALMG